MTWNQAKGELSDDSEQMNLTAQMDLAAKGKNKFLITAKTSAPVERWGETVYIDLEGIRTDAKLPILRQHDPNSVVGSGESFTKENTFFIEGEFSAVTKTAKEVKALADEGYPWQASIGIWVEKIERLESEKIKAQVNGQEISGPAIIWRESFVREVSFVAVGADDRTVAISLTGGATSPADYHAAVRFYQDQGDPSPYESAMKRHPDLFKTHHKRLLRAFSLGVQEKKEKDMTKQNKDYMAQVHEYQATNGCTLVDAMNAINKKDPAARVAYLEKNNPGRSFSD